MKKKSKRKKIVMVSKHKTINPVSILRDRETGEISYRMALKAIQYSAGDYFPGLVIDRNLKRAWYRRPGWDI